MAGTADHKDAESGKRMLERVAVPFLCGYRKQAHLPAHWYDMFPLFFRYRRLAQYKFVSNLFYDRENPHEDYLAWVKEDILSGSKYLDFDFHSLKQK